MNFHLKKLLLKMFGHKCNYTSLKRNMPSRVYLKRERERQLFLTKKSAIITIRLDTISSKKYIDYVSIFDAVFFLSMQNFDIRRVALFLNFIQYYKSNFETHNK